jgi:hypothetical protein
MPVTTHDGFKIEGFSDGTLFKARVERSDCAEFRANGKPTRVWETPQHMDAAAAVGQAIYAIDTGKLK